MTNLLLLWTDEQRADTIGPGADPHLRTPNLTRLTERSVAFEQTYCAIPVCTPSRATILTGTWPHTHGALHNNIPLRQETPTIADLLHPRGYRCGYAGKWHLGNELQPQHGFLESWSSCEDGYVKDHRRDGFSTYHQWLVAKGFSPPDAASDGSRVFSRTTAARLPEAAGKPAFLAEAACHFLDTVDRRPFFLSVNFLEPHMPFTSPRDGMYDPRDMALPPSWYREPDATVPLRYRLRRDEYRRQNRHVATNDEPGWQALKARYFGLMSLIDTYVGRILDHLAALGLATDTLVVFTSDHGEMMGEHRLIGKGVSYEGATRVPLLLSHPSLTPRQVTTPVSQIDLVPTLLDLLGQETPPHLQGRSLRPLLEAGDSAPAEAEIVIEWSGAAGGVTADGHRFAPADGTGADPTAVRALSAQQRTIRRGRWKLTVDEAGDHELYDLASDPGELSNLIARAACTPSPESLATARDLWRRLQGWQRRAGDALRLPQPVGDS